MLKSVDVAGIQNNGFVDPIKVRETDTGFEIVDGEHRWRAACELGYEELPAINLGPLSDAQAKKLTIILNELKGSPEPVMLAAVLRDLVSYESAENLSKELPMTVMEIDTLLRSTSDFTWESQPVPDVPAASNVDAAGSDRKFQLGSVRGNIPTWVCAALMEEFERSAVAVRSRTPEIVLAHWIERLASSPVAAPPAPEVTSASSPTAQRARRTRAQKETPSA